jgi:hypothetical protein
LNCKSWEEEICFSLLKTKVMETKKIPYEKPKIKLLKPVFKVAYSTTAVASTPPKRKY